MEVALTTFSLLFATYYNVYFSWRIPALSPLKIQCPAHDPFWIALQEWEWKGVKLLTVYSSMKREVKLKTRVERKTPPLLSSAL